MAVLLNPDLTIEEQCHCISRDNSLDAEECIQRARELVRLSIRGPMRDILDILWTDLSADDQLTALAGLARQQGELGFFLQQILMSVPPCEPTKMLAIVLRNLSHGQAEQFALAERALDKYEMTAGLDRLTDLARVGNREALLHEIGRLRKRLKV
jgi:hypothetical protein